LFQAIFEVLEFVLPAFVMLVNNQTTIQDQYMTYFYKSIFHANYLDRYINILGSFIFNIFLN